MPYYIETTTHDDAERYFVRTPEADTANKRERLTFKTEDEAREFGRQHKTDGAIKHTGRALDWIVVPIAFLFAWVTS